MKTTAFLILAVLIISCGNENNTNENKTTDSTQSSYSLIINDDVYEIINKIICDSLFKPDLISMDPIFFSISNDSDYTSGDPPPPPPPPGVICYDSFFWDHFKDGSIFDSSDIKSMKAQIASTNRMIWDSLKLKTKVFSRDLVISMFRSNQIKDITAYLKEKYNANNYISISSPLYSVDRTKVILSIEFYSGDNFGGGSIYVFENINNQWKVVFETSTWIS